MKYAIVGTGGRHQMYRTAIAANYGNRHSLVALCDANAKRAELSAQWVSDNTNRQVPTYSDVEFDRMIAEQKPDVVVVTTPDFTHNKYITAALRAGCDVMTEKPMTVNMEKLKEILDVQRETGRSVTVTFNYRYTPARTQIKDLLMKGTIGEVTAVDFRWYLDRVHGADYFRRWHRYKEKSGGLLVHKSTHHFDLMNWWLSSTPKRVNAMGRRAFYTPEMAIELGLAGHGPRCHGCPVAEKCDFRLDLDNDAALKALYLDAESDDGYLRDKCVFADDITIEDTMQVQVEYANRTTMNYTLQAYSPWEGLEIKFRGTKGDITHRHVEVHGVFGGKRERPDGEAMTTEIHLAGQEPQQIEVWHGTGDHGGADPVMLGYLFDADNVEPDRYDRSSNQVMGAWSILSGIAANGSLASGQVVDVDALLKSYDISLPRH
ncbi:MAG TPA: Gfo/Idh/MocA family oxidoreductase [Devosiaceae bacterium]|jgi:predicted dehydrogenase